MTNSTCTDDNIKKAIAAETRTTKTTKTTETTTTTAMTANDNHRHTGSEKKQH